MTGFLQDVSITASERGWQGCPTLSTAKGGILRPPLPARRGGRKARVRYFAHVLSLTICLATLAAAQTAKPPLACGPPAKYRTVAERPVPGATKAKYLIVVDQDARVLLLLLGETAKVEETELLGYEPELVPDSPLVAALPKGQALLTLRRISCPDRWRLWVALTIGMAEGEGRRFALTNSLHVFREDKAGTGLASLVSETFPEGAELTVDDINTDLLTEIAVQYAVPEATFTSMLKLWQVDASGEPRPVPLDNVLADVPRNALHAEIGLADYRHGEDVIFTEARTRTAGGTLVVRRNYSWDDSSRRYTLRGVVRTRETAIK